MTPTKKEIIIYPDNSMCIDGRLLYKDEQFLKELGIELVRQADRVYNTPDARIVAFGASSCLKQIIEPRIERRSETFAMRRRRWDAPNRQQHLDTSNAIR